MNNYKRISVHEADDLLSACPDAILLDTRNELSFKISHHPRAKHLTEAVMSDIFEYTPKETPIITYGLYNTTSSQTAKIFSNFGFEHCFSVDGGYNAWRNRINYQSPKTDRLKCWLADSKNKKPFAQNNVRFRSTTGEAQTAD